jgi:hypothetical protein
LRTVDGTLWSFVGMFHAVGAGFCSWPLGGGDVIVVVLRTGKSMTFRTEAIMDGTAYKDYFLKPLDGWHRRYEVLRAVFIDEHPMQQVAQRFGVSYGTVRNWAGEFRHHWDVKQRPPFSRRRPVVARRSRPTTTSPRSPSQTSKRCRWRRGDG